MSLLEEQKTLRGPYENPTQVALIWPKAVVDKIDEKRDILSRNKFLLKLVVEDLNDMETLEASRKD